ARRYGDPTCGRLAAPHGTGSSGERGRADSIPGWSRAEGDGEARAVARPDCAMSPLSRLARPHQPTSRSPPARSKTLKVVYRNKKSGALRYEAWYSFEVKQAAKVRENLEASRSS